MLYQDVVPIASLCMPAPLAVSQETCRGNDASALNFTVHGSPSYGGTSVVIFGLLLSFYSQQVDKKLVIATKKPLLSLTKGAFFMSKLLYDYLIKVAL